MLFEGFGECLSRPSANHILQVAVELGVVFAPDLISNVSGVARKRLDSQNTAKSGKLSICRHSNHHVVIVERFKHSVRRDQWMGITLSRVVIFTV